MSEINFYITGCPRSGSAWLSNAMNHGGECFCFHECERDMLMSAPDVQRDTVMRRLYEKHHFSSGNVSSGMLSWDLDEEDGPLVIIDRNWDEVECSTRFAMLEWGVKDLDVDLNVIRESYAKFLENHSHAKIVDFNNLFTVETLMEIWQHCLPMLIPPVDRFKEVVRHRVTLSNFDYQLATT